MRKTSTGILLVLPATFLIMFVLIIPLFFTLFTSLHNYDYLQLGKFIGLDNYRSILNDKSIVLSIYRGLGSALIALTGSMFFGIIAAFWIDSKKGKYAYALQLLCLIPWFTSMLISAIVWKWIFNSDYGVINYLLKSIGLAPLGVPTDARLAFFVMTAIIAWRSVGYVMILILSGLKSISEDVLEAAKVDGANYLQTIFYIKFPNIKSQITLALIIITLGNINNSVIPLSFNSGGPGDATTVVALKLYYLGFRYFQFGPASALSVVLLLINVVIIFFYMRALKYE